jgi:hypothetical protein
MKNRLRRLEHEVKRLARSNAPSMGLWVGVEGSRLTWLAVSPSDPRHEALAALQAGKPCTLFLIPLAEESPKGLEPIQAPPKVLEVIQGYLTRRGPVVGFLEL